MFVPCFVVVVIFFSEISILILSKEGSVKQNKKHADLTARIHRLICILSLICTFLVVLMVLTDLSPGLENTGCNIVCFLGQFFCIHVAIYHLVHNVESVFCLC